MKKLWIAFSLFVVTVLLAVTSFASAVGAPVIKVNDGIASPGETVRIQLTITDNPGILGTKLTLTYSDKLTLIGATNGTAFADLSMTEPGQKTSPCNFVWDGVDLAPGDIRNGTVLTLEFRVSSQAQVGDELSVDLSCRTGDTIDRELQAVSLQVVSGKIRVAGNASIAAASARQTGNNISVTLYSGNTYQGLLLVAASYSNSSQMTGCVTQRVDAVPGENIYQLSLNRPGETCRVFILDHRYSPCYPAVSVTN